MDKVRFLNQLDVFSVPTAYLEPKWLYLLETWACGVPVVYPAHGSFPELIQANSGGVPVPPGDTTALAEQIALLLSNTAERHRMGQAARQVVREQFSSQSTDQATAELLDVIVTKAKMP